MSDKMKEQIKNLSDEVSKLDSEQQNALSLIAQGMAIQAELDAERIGKK